MESVIPSAIEHLEQTEAWAKQAEGFLQKLWADLDKAQHPEDCECWACTTREAAGFLLIDRSRP
jgi:hypothetical protein